MENTVLHTGDAARKHIQPLYTTPQRLLLDLVQIFVGSVLCAVAVNGILVPKNFATGGITGLCLIIHRVIPSLNLGLIYLLVNIPLFLLAWMYVGQTKKIVRQIDPDAFVVISSTLEVMNNRIGNQPHW